MKTPALATLPLSWKLLITGFLFILGSGYLAGATHAVLSVGISPQAVAEHYGDKSLSPEEAQALEQQGFVEEEFSLDDEESAMDHSEMDHGAMDMEGDAPVMERGDDTLPPEVLSQVSHIHLLGFSWILLGVGTLACLAGWSEKTRITVVTLLTLSLFGDIAGLNLTRFVADGFAWLTVISATTVGLLLLVVTLRVLWELWLQPKPQGDTR